MKTDHTVKLICVTNEDSAETRSPRKIITPTSSTNTLSSTHLQMAVEEEDNCQRLKKIVSLSIPIMLSMLIQKVQEVVNISMLGH